VLKRITFFIRATFVVVITIFDSLKVVVSILLKLKKYDFFKHYRGWSRNVLRLSGVKIQVTGKEYLDPNSNYVYITNHSSLFDIPIIFTALEDNVRIMYKKELENIPIFGYCLKVSPFIAVTRTDPRNAMRSIEEAVETIRRDTSVIVYPEGTRSKTGELGTFKRGAFMVASRSGKPIVPVAIVGSSQILLKGTYYFNRRNIKVVIHKPIQTQSNPTKQEETELMQRVWSELQETLNQNK